MTTLADILVPDELWRSSPRCCRPRRVPGRVGGPHDSRPGVLCRDHVWLVPPPRGGCCPLASLAAVPTPPFADGWTSGWPPGCSSASTATSWIGWAWRGRSTGPGQRGHHERACPAWGSRRPNPVDRGKPGSKLHLGTDKL